MIIITDLTGRSWVTGCALCILTGKNTAGPENSLEKGSRRYGNAGK